MTERPILFSAPMVRALLDGSKTQTRRAVEMPPSWDCIVYADWGNGWWPYRSDDGESPFYDNNEIPLRCPYGVVGDRLWVRETWRHTASSVEEARAITEDIASGTAVDWRATYIDRCMNELGFSREDAEMADSFERWRPSIHMPRWASRILLEIMSVRVERLQDISEADAAAEGWVKRPDVSTDPAVHADAARDWYADLWGQINGAGSWGANPWVWVVEFRRIER